ncbi:MAG: hypothetical protein ACTTKU_02355 [Eggerthia catenaformis]|uniref:hypothetical protein n=1 Tax=Eggerthia catenaformis TaxID=31973 RepID=UPI003FA13ED0
MEKQTRTDKYKELRASLSDKEEKTKKVIEEVTDETDDDFLAFLPKKEEKLDELHPLTYDSLKEDEAVRTAIKEAKINVGKQEYNTRMDILNKLKKDHPVRETEDKNEDYDAGYDVSKAEVVEEAAQEIEDEESKMEETLKSLPKENVRIYGIDEKETSSDEIEEIEEKEPKKKSIVPILLDIIIVILIIVFVTLCIIYFKKMF